MSFRILSIFALALCSCSEGATVEERPIAKEDLEYVQTVMGNCVIDQPNKVKIEAAAKSLGWKLVDDPSLKTMIGPESGNTQWKAWAFKADQRSYILSIGDADIDGITLPFCQVISEVSESDLIAKKLVGLLKAEAGVSDTENGQRTRTYKFGEGSDTALLTLLDAEEMGMNMLNATVLYGAEKE